MRASRSRHHRRSQSTLHLPSKRQVSHFREMRLLTHLHEQLIEQISQNPNDWQLHFQLGNLLAFTDDSFYKNKSIDIFHAETHYQKALKLLKTLHEQDYIIYQNANKIQFESINTPISSAFDVDMDIICTPDVLYENEEEKFAQPKVPIITAQLLLLSDNYADNEGSLSISSNKKKLKMRKKRSCISIKSNKSTSDIDLSHKKRRKKCCNKERERNKNSNNNDNHTSSPKKRNGFEISPPTQPNPHNRMKQRQLLIAIHDNDNTIAKEIKCKYASPMSEDELAMERERCDKKKNSKKLRVNITATYLTAVAILNQPYTKKKRPSIIMSFDPGSPQNNGGKDMCRLPDFHLNGAYSNNSPISLMQSESETATVDTVDEYNVPFEINKGYTECFFGYGKYLCQNKRVKEGVHNLLECASWYNDSFVDPSCLTSLVLPPQFLFQDSVKKRHCINFRTLSKYISKLLMSEQRYLDKQFKKMNIEKYIKEYDTYLAEFEEEVNKNITIVINAGGITPMTGLTENGISNETANLSPVSVPMLDFALSNTSNMSNLSAGGRVSDLRLIATHSNHSVQSDASYQMLSTPDMLSGDSNISYDNENRDRDDNNNHKNKVQLINYRVYPQEIQDLVNEYIDLCSYYHRLGLLLTDFLRYGDAKREYSKAIKIFKILKIKPPLYENILSEIRMSQRSSIRSASCQERAQMLALKRKGSNIRAPLSPTFEFSFSDQFQQNTNGNISPFLIKAK